MIKQEFHLSFPETFVLFFFLMTFCYDYGLKTPPGIFNIACSFTVFSQELCLCFFVHVTH